MEALKTHSTITPITSSNDSCTVFSKDYDTIRSVISVTLCVFGVVYTFFGYRCFKAVMFMSGLMFGGSAVYAICKEERLFQTEITSEMAAGIAAGIGILCGLITMLVRYVGLFLQGFFLGFLLAIAGIVTLQPIYHPSTPWIPAGILFGCGVFFSVITLKYQKGCVIISTAVLGSALVVLCVDYFLEKWILLRFMWEALMAAKNINLCWYSWIIFGAWPSLSISGILLQWNVTAKGFDHTDVIIQRGRRKHIRTHLYRQNSRTPAPGTSGGGNQQRRQAGERGPSSLSSGRRERESNETRQTRQPRETIVVAQEAPMLVTRVVLEEEDDDDSETPPPSYFECVELGVGDPVSENPRSVSSSNSQAQRRLVTVSNSSRNRPPQPSAATNASTSGYVETARSRPTDSNRTASNCEPIHVDINQFSEPKRRKKVQSKNSGRSKQQRVETSSGSTPVPAAVNTRATTQGAGSAPRSSGSNRHQSPVNLSSTTTVVARPPRNNAEAVAAHAQRLLAQEKKLARRSIAGGSQPAPTSSTSRPPGS